MSVSTECPSYLIKTQLNLTMYVQWATSEFRNSSLSKWGQVHNLSCENEFYLHENEKLFSYQMLSTSPRFDTEALRNSEMAYFLDKSNPKSKY